ncbi:hypothetical protein E2562_031976 [Oryza meyeriana var. granulata]|uniref:Uncharacterized protein n=1 Tax=Oryza meyeriana var. granulata TaxID=110450 RepID=A0A6G1F068_9ORYZ|nr:hypothetical protein E2562_031976 [Oryza meyeriana var. granulata]
MILPPRAAHRSPLPISPDAQLPSPTAATPPRRSAAAAVAPPPPIDKPFVVVAVRPGGSASRRAARWAAANFPAAGDGDGRAATAISVVHVIPPLRFVPSPSASRCRWNGRLRRRMRGTATLARKRRFAPSAASSPPTPRM